MRKVFVASSLLLALCSVGHAQRIVWEPVGVEPTFGSSGTGSRAGNSGYSSDDSGSSRGYRGSSGSRYEYDMNNPADRARYSINLDAQRRDQLSVDVGRSQDRLRGQYGGGLIDE